MNLLDLISSSIGLDGNKALLSSGLRKGKGKGKGPKGTGVRNPGGQIENPCRPKQYTFCRKHRIRYDGHNHKLYPILAFMKGNKSNHNSSNSTPHSHVHFTIETRPSSPSNTGITLNARSWIFSPYQDSNAAFTAACHNSY